MSDAVSSPIITIRNVADRAGVSVGTVSKALNGTGRVSAETRERISGIAESLGFRPNPIARSMRSQRSYSIGLLTDDTYGRFSLPIMSGVTQGLTSKGLSVLLCATDGSREMGQSQVEMLADKRVDGLIISGRRVDRVPEADLSGLDLPIVYALTRGPASAVTLAPDEAQGARVAVEHLLERGYRRVAHVTGPERFCVAVERAASWRETAGARAHGEALHGPWSESWGHRAAAMLFDGVRAEERPDAVFCGNDQIGRGMIDALRERGVSVPGCVAVVGFDNWEVVSSETRPPLSSIDLNLGDLGREAGLALTRMIDGAGVPTGLMRMPCTLVERASSGGGRDRPDR